jgi:hypothetical protein
MHNFVRIGDTPLSWWSAFDCKTRNEANLVKDYISVNYPEAVVSISEYKNNDNSIRGLYITYYVCVDFNNEADEAEFIMRQHA